MPEIDDSEERRHLDQWRRVYESAAHEPDWVRAHRWSYGAEVADRTVDDIREKLRLRNDDYLLEVGSGSGALLQRLLHPEQAACGTDLCEELVRQAPRFGVDTGRIRLLVSEAGRLPFPRGSFDKVLCYSVFQCFPSRSYAGLTVRECLRVVRPGGRVLLGDICGQWEHLLQSWRASGLSRETLGAVLTLPAAAPLRLLGRAMRGLRSPAREPEVPWRRYYTRRFFRRLGRRLGCEVEILPQRIPGRAKVSERRFDVVLHKPDAARA